MKVFVLTEHVPHEAADLLGVFPSPEAAELHSDGEVPGDDSPAWVAVPPPGGGPLTWVTVDVPGSQLKITEHEMALGGTFQADAEVLRAAADVLKRRFGNLFTGIDQRMLENSARIVERMASPAAAEPPP